MKRCPECRRDYYDDSLLYCLDDGSALLEGPALRSGIDQLPTVSAEAPTQQLRDIREPLASRPPLVSSFRSVGTPSHDYYLRGKMSANSENQEINACAITILEDVVAMDPTFAPAYAHLGRAYSIKANFWAPDNEKARLFEEAKFALQKSLALEPDLAEAHFARGTMIWTHAERFPHEQAIRSLKRAIELDPNLEEAHHQLGLIYYHIGLLDKGQEEIEKTLDLDPADSLARFRLGAIEMYRTDYRRALAILKTVPADANPAIVERAMASILFALGKIQEAERIVNDFLAAHSDEGGNITSVKAMLLAKAGREREAEEAISHAIDVGKNFQHFHHTTYNIATAYALMGNCEDAAKWLQFTADDGFPCYPYFEKDANIDGIRSDGGFIEMMANMKHQWEHYRSTL